MTIRTKPSTDAFREGWDRAFGKRGGQCIGCGRKILDCRCNEWTGDGPTLAPVDAPLEAEVARLAADSPPSSDGWSVLPDIEHFLPKHVADEIKKAAGNVPSGVTINITAFDTGPFHSAIRNAIKKPKPGST